MRYEHGQIAELRWKGKGPKNALGQYHRQNDPELDWWKVAGREGFVDTSLVEVVKTFVLIPVTIPEAETTEHRPSFQWLMAAQEALGEARDAEQAAGNTELATLLNNTVLGLFALALRVAE